MERALAAAIILTAVLPAAASPRRAAVATAGEIPAGPPLYPVRSTEPIVFIWPPENMALAAESTFILGSVSPATAPFTINGTPVPVHKDGGFLAWLPIAPGTFTFRAELALSSTTTATAERRILVPLPATPFPGKMGIDLASLSPKADLELRGGDLLTVRMKGTPGKAARFRLGNNAWQPMRQVNSALGTYEGSWLVPPGANFDPESVEYELGAGWSSTKEKGSARVSASARPFPVATVKFSTAGYASVKTGPANGFLMFPLPGTRLPVTGRDGASLRVRLSDSLSGWIEAKDVEVATSAALPRSVTGTIGVAKTDNGATVKIGLSEKAAFAVEPSAGLDALTVRLYNATDHTNWMINDAPDFVKEIRWRQEATDVVAVTILLKPNEVLWGWWPSYDNGSLRLELRRAPNISAYRPLAGIKVMLDPGHMPTATGSTGPLGTLEMDANYAIALAAKARLEREGATVLMTRADPLHEVSLVDRPKQAVERGADLFISLHNNALPDGVNPWSNPRGFSIFHYHPQSLELGRAVHAAYRDRIKLPDEGLRWGNLLVARQSAMPALLIENAYMIFPDQEAMLNDAAFREELAKALVTGLENFLRAARRKP